MESTRPGTAARTHFDGSRARLEVSGIPVRAELRSEQSGGSVVSKLARLLGLVRSGRRAAHAGILIARWHPFLAFVSPVWRRRGGRVLVLVQGNDESAYEANPWLRRIPGVTRLMDRSLATASAILTVNRGLEEWMRTVPGVDGRVPIEVMPAGVSTVFFDAEPVSEERPYALFFGGLAPWQGVDYMLAAKRSSDWPAGVDLVVIGDGASAPQVESAQGETLRWLGAQPPARVAEYAAGAVCTLCPKSNTGSMAKTTTPLKILESIAAGVPVVATDIPAQAEMLEDGYGILVDGDDPTDLARAVARIAEDDALRARLVERARAVGPRYRWTAAAPQLAAAIARLDAEIPA